ncbi:MAG: hypothetical protein ACRDRX_20540 [Pseudonocardiaceae bacterium]
MAGPLPGVPPPEAALRSDRLDGHPGDVCRGAQATKAGIVFTALDNGFATVDDPAALQALCDRLGPDQIDGLLRTATPAIAPTPATVLTVCAAAAATPAEPAVVTAWLPMVGTRPPCAVFGAFSASHKLNRLGSESELSLLSPQ